MPGSTKAGEVNHRAELHGTHDTEAAPRVGGSRKYGSVSSQPATSA